MLRLASFHGKALAYSLFIPEKSFQIGEKIVNTHYCRNVRCEVTCGGGAFVAACKNCCVTCHMSLGKKEFPPRSVLKKVHGCVVPTRLLEF